LLHYLFFIALIEALCLLHYVTDILYLIKDKVRDFSLNGLIHKNIKKNSKQDLMSWSVKTLVSSPLDLFTFFFPRWSGPRTRTWRGHGPFPGGLPSKY